MGNLSELDEVGQGGGGGSGLATGRRPVAGSGPGLDARFRARSAWLARTERDLAAARVSAEAGCPDWMALAKQLQAMLDAAADADCLTTVDRARLAEQARVIGRLAYRRGVEELLEEVETAPAEEPPLKREVLLDRAEALLGKLKRLKLEPEIYERLTLRIARMREAGWYGSAPASEPHDLLPRPAVGERRLFPRYREPRLTLQLGSHYTRTVNWSVSGLMLASAPPGLVAGTRLDLACWIAGGHRYEDEALVVRQEADGRLILKMRRFGSKLVELKQECERRRQPPRA